MPVQNIMSCYLFNTVLEKMYEDEYNLTKDEDSLALYKKYKNDAEKYYIQMVRFYDERHKNLIYNTIMSNKKHTFEDFWDTISELYHSCGYKNITNAIDGVLDDSKIQYGIYPNCICIPYNDSFMVCEFLQVQLICTKFQKYLKNLIDFAENEKLIDEIIFFFYLPTRRLLKVVSTRIGILSRIPKYKSIPFSVL